MQGIDTSIFLPIFQRKAPPESHRNFTFNPLREGRRSLQDADGYLATALTETGRCERHRILQNPLDNSVE